jgi:galactose-1-phosphate uridylyltransferase
MSITFKKIESKTRFLNPFKEFSLDEIPFEIRFDPLTGETGRVYDLQYKPPERSDLEQTIQRSKEMLTGETGRVYDLQYKPPERSDLEQTIQRSKEMFCPFCPESLEKSTPLFPKEFIPEGRITEGEATLIPNLVPFDTYAGVSVVSREHYLGIEDLNPEKLKDSFSATLLFVQRVVDFDPQVQFFSINWNYMPESGSSLVHPHLQVNCGYVPTNHHRAQIEGCTRYLNENGRSFWKDFISAEKKSGERSGILVRLDLPFGS